MIVAHVSFNKILKDGRQREYARSKNVTVVCLEDLDCNCREDFIKLRLPNDLHYINHFPLH